MIGDNSEPTGGVPSLTDGEIYILYQKYFHRDPDARELASERENAMKYSAAGIERQIANRASNTAGSGVRGDEGLPALTVAAPPPAIADNHAGNIVTMGAAAFAPGATASGPTGNIQGMYGGGGSALAPGYYASGAPGVAPASTIFGMSTTTVLLLLAIAGAGYYFLVVRK